MADSMMEINNLVNTREQYRNVLDARHTANAPTNNKQINTHFHSIQTAKL